MFSELKEQCVGPDLISGFFSAMCLFSKELINKKPEIMEIEDIRLVFRESGEHIFVAIVDENESIAQVQDILDKIRVKFYQNYGSYLSNWDRDIELFRGFEKQIEMVIIKADIDRIMLIEKLENLLEVEDDSKIDGLLILTSKGDLMLSSIKNTKIQQYVVKIIENNWRMGVSTKHMSIELDRQQILIEEISNFLISAIVMKKDVSIELARTICKYLFKKLRLQVQQKVTSIPEI